MAMEGRTLNFILRKDEPKKSYERREYEVVAGQQQFTTTRTKLLPPVIR